MTAFSGLLKPEADRAELLDRAAELWRLGLSQSGIASRLGLTRSALGGAIAHARLNGSDQFPPRAASNQHGHGGASPGSGVRRAKRVASVVQGGSLTAKSAPEAVMAPQIVERRSDGPPDAVNGGLEPEPTKAAAPDRREGVSLIDLPYDGCRYPVNESGPIRFCCARCEFGKSWCSRHAAIVRSGPSSVLPRASSAVAASRPQGSV
jgi:hypothetical protein